jgi:leader peptidase (prepilin peptidase) / N-methyltransferase
MHLQSNAGRSTTIPQTRTLNRILNPRMIRTLVTLFAGLLGLAFGSFLNVCLSRWPEDESVVHPRSHCRNCEHSLAWWENIPLLSWILLRGKCRECRTLIGLRYPVVELAVGGLWAYTAWAFEAQFFDRGHEPPVFLLAIIVIVGQFLFYWLMIALAALDAEHLWLPNVITLPGIALGIAVSFITELATGRNFLVSSEPLRLFGERVLAIIVTAGVLLLIRWLYWVFRHREGMGLGDVKLIAMLAAWLGLPATLLAFFIGSMLGAIAGLIVIALPATRDEGQGWATTKLPFGTFLCIGGIASSLWGQPIIAAYLHAMGF